MADVTLSLTGNSTTVVTSAGYSVPDWSNGYAGNAGYVLGVVIDYNLTFSINGVSTSCAVGSVIPLTSYTLSGVSSTLSAGSVTTSQIVNVALTGVDEFASVGSVGTNQNVTISLSGVQTNLMTGSETPSQEVSRAITGVSSSGNPGSVGFLRSYTPSGVVATCAVGNITTSQTLTRALLGNVLFGSAGQIYGPGDVIINLSGVSAVASIAPTAAPYNTYTVPTELDLTHGTDSDSMGVVILLNKKSRITT